MSFPTALRAAPILEPSALDVLEAIETPAAFIGPDGRVVAVNAAALAVSEDRTPGLLFVEGRTWAELCQHSGATGSIAADLEAVLQIRGMPARSTAIDYAVRTAGRLKTYRLTARTLGQSDHILVVQTDSTRLEAAEQRLKEAERRQADLAELSSDWVWTTDEELVFVELTASSDPLWRRVQPRLVGQSCAEKLAEVAELISRRRPFRDAPLEIAIDGRVRHLRFSGKPLFGADGGFHGYLGVAIDLTREHEAESARDAAEARLREIAELSSDWYWETDCELRYTYVSEDRRGAVQLDPERTYGRRRIELIDRELTDPEALARHLDDLEHRRPFRDFVYGSNSLGPVCYLKVSGNPRFGKDGEFLGYVGTASDITPIVAVEKRRKLAERRLKAAVDQMPSGIAIWDADDRLVVHNEQYLTIAGLDRGEKVVGLTFEETVRNALHAGAISLPETSVEEFVKARVDMHQKATLSREVAYASGRIALIRERRLKGGGMVTVIGDVTDLKRRERIQTEQRALLQTTLEHISDGILVVDKDWRIVAINDNFSTLLDMPDGVVGVGARLSAVFEWLSLRGDYGGELAAATAARLIEEIKSHPHWYDERTTPDGRRIFWRVREMQGGGHIIAVADVSEQRQAEERREQLRGTMLRAEKLEAISRLAGGLAHDLNNMLLPIMTLTELAMDELPEGSPARGDLERVIGAAEHARGLVQRLLTFSRTTPQGLGAAMVDPAVRAAVDLIQPLVGPNLRIVLRLEAGAAIPLSDTEIQQIVVNLGQNAAQAIGDLPGTLTIETGLIEADDDLLRSILTLDSARSHVRLTVADDGPGIPGDVLPRIFEPFFTTKAVGQGTGLGLAVVHGLVGQVGGAIEINGEGGARFDIMIPILDQPINPQGNPNGAHTADR